jgi:hypothetical protein
MTATAALLPEGLVILVRLLARQAARRWLAELQALATESVAPADKAAPQPDAGSIGGGRSGCAAIPVLLTRDEVAAVLQLSVRSWSSSTRVGDGRSGSGRSRRRPAGVR